MSLDQIALRHGADKASNVHNYTSHYEKHFGHLRNDPDVVLFECGYGGYHYPDRGGAGARTWREYFTKATIVSTDIHQKMNVPDGVKFFIGPQADPDFWEYVILRVGAPDLFIDDASHVNDLTIKTFEIMFPLLRPGGCYVVEDLESSHWQEPAADGTDFKGCADPENFSAATALNFLRWLTIDVNSKHIHQHQQKFPVESIHFYDNIAFIYKKR